MKKNTPSDKPLDELENSNNQKFNKKSAVKNNLVRMEEVADKSQEIMNNGNAVSCTNETNEEVDNNMDNTINGEIAHPLPLGQTNTSDYNTPQKGL